MFGWSLLLGITVILAALLAQYYGRYWLQARMSHAPVRMLSLVGMSFRQVPIGLIVKAKIVLVQAGLDAQHQGPTTAELEAQYLAGGDVEKVVKAIVVASRSGLALDFDRAATIDLAGRDVLEAVQTSVLPRVINCPDRERSDRQMLVAVAKDGVELRIQASVTVRTNLALLVGGATEATIVARVGQGIIAAVGAAEYHGDVLCKPDAISKLLIRSGLDSQTAYQIVSIDIARIDVGSNIGARIRTDQAEAEMRVSQACSEGRRALAIAQRTEMQALRRQRQAELVLAESAIYPAMGLAIRQGRVGRTDYCETALPGRLAPYAFTDRHPCLIP